VVQALTKPESGRLAFADATSDGEGSRSAGTVFDNDALASAAIAAMYSNAVAGFDILMECSFVPRPSDEIAPPRYFIKSNCSEALLEIK
jgi:hypothetical protein